MTDSKEFADARDRMGAWKRDAVLCFQRSLIHHALERESATFTVDIVPDEDRAPGQGIAGCATRILSAASVIEPVLVGSTMAGWAQMERKSERATRNRAKVKVYRITNRGIAVEWLRRNGGYTGAGTCEQSTMEGIA